MVEVGFNNFKAFEENLQKFSDKPITLVYSSNSSGKSSFLYHERYA
jgi:purine NTPase involved in DNA repair, rad50